MLITRPSPLPGHDAQRLAPDQERAAQIDPDQPVEIRRRGLEQRLLDQDAGVVDQDVETAERGERTLEHRQHRRLVGDVRAYGEGAAAAGMDLGDDRLDLGLRREIVHRHMGALGRKRERDRAADPARSAGDQRALAVERARHAITSPRSTWYACPVTLAACSEARKR